VGSSCACRRRRAATAFLAGGGSCRPESWTLSDTPSAAAEMRFRPEDGSFSALLRAVQPAIKLDRAGRLCSPATGQAFAGLAAVEALSLAASVEGAIVLSNDFGDGLDAATAEHVAAVLRAQAARMADNAAAIRSNAGVRSRGDQDGESAMITARSWRAQTTSGCKPASASQRTCSVMVLGWSHTPSIGVTSSFWCLRVSTRTHQNVGGGLTGSACA
jgi:hypothetical protein